MLVLLEILKWIVIVLLYLLLFLFCVLLLVLFLPIKYYGKGTYNKEEQYAFLKARWFWGLVRVKAAFPKKPYLSVKILWIELFKEKEKEPLKKTVESQDKKSEKKEEVKETTSSITEVDFEKSMQEERVVNEAVVQEQNTEQTESSKDKEPIGKKLIGIKEKIQYYIGVLTEQDTKDLLVHCKKRIIKILKSIRPRKIKFNGIIGFASPDTTGYLYGAYCMVSSYLGKNVILEPEFEKEIIDVTGSLKGRITVFVLAWNALRVYLDKRLMRLISKLKKGGR